MKRFTTKKSRAKRPSRKSINLSPRALAIWDSEAKQHNWSKEISWYLVGLYATTGVTTPQRVTILRRLRAGILAEIKEHKKDMGDLSIRISNIDKEIKDLLEK